MTKKVFFSSLCGEFYSFNTLLLGSYSERSLRNYSWCDKFDLCLVPHRRASVLGVLKYVAGLAVRVFANGKGDLGSIPGRVIPKTQKMVLDASLLNTQHYKVRIKGKVKQSREGVAPSPTPWCSSYRKESLRVTLDYGRQLYFTFI